MTNKLKNVNNHPSGTRILLVLPFVILTIVPIFVDSNGLPKLFALVLGVLFLVTFTTNYLSFKDGSAYLPLALLMPYMISQIINPNNIDKFLIGSPGRNGGFIAWFSLSILFLYFVKLYRANVFEFSKIPRITYLFFLAIGLLQYFEWLPWKQSMEFNGLSITLGNPNFASAMLAIMCSAHVVLLLYGHSKRKLASFFVLGIAIFELWQTKSLQGGLVVAVNIFVISLVRFRESIRVFIRRKSYVAFVLLSIVLASFLFNRFLLDWFIANGSVRQRLAYWKLSLEIFRDNFWFGVGIDNLRSKVLEYRSLDLVKQEGIFTIPDRTHNVLLDHLVNGGIFAGIIWLIFITSITFFAVKLIWNVNDREKKREALFLAVIWMGYLVQSLISVDHLALTLIGYISAAGIFALRENSTPQDKSILKTNFGVLKSGIVATLSSFLIYLALFTASEVNAFKIIYGNNLQPVQSVLDNRWIQAQTLEDVAVHISQAKQFELANQFADKILESSPKSHQAFYMKSVYQESLGNNLKGRDWMLEAHKVDPLNPVYLLSLAIYEYKLGNLDMARMYVEKTEEIDPNQKALIQVKNLL